MFPHVQIVFASVFACNTLKDRDSVGHLEQRSGKLSACYKRLGFPRLKASVMQPRACVTVTWYSKSPFLQGDISAEKCQYSCIHKMWKALQVG